MYTSGFFDYYYIRRRLGYRTKFRYSQLWSATKFSVMVNGTAP